MRAPSVASAGTTDVWARLADPLGPALSAHEDRRRSPAGLAESVGDAELVRRRLDATVPGAWELHVELQSVGDTSRFVVKSRLTVLGIAREDFGEGFSLASASDDGLTKAARRFGIGVEAGSTVAATLTVAGRPSVPVAMGVADTPAVPSADDELAAVFRSEPAVRKQKAARAATPDVSEESATAVDAAPSGARRSAPKARKDSELRPTISADEEFPSCPRCGDIMWDDRGAKKSADAPDFRCRRRGCVGTLWVDRSDAQPTTPAVSASAEARDEEYPF